jgi:hypothetical protein
VPDHDGDPVRHELSCRGQPSLGIAVVVDDVDDDLLAEDSARRVELRHRQLDAVLHLLAGEFHFPGQRPGVTDEDLGGRWIVRPCKCRNRD